MIAPVPGLIDRLIRRPTAFGMLGVAVLAVLYPLFADATQQPLTIFVVPILIVSALGTWTESAVVGAVALAVAAAIALVSHDFDTTGLVTRLAVMLVCAGLAVFLAYERGRRQVMIDESTARGVLLDAFQDSLVPEPIPPAGFTVATRYLPGDTRLALGGDFFDAIRLPNGSLGYIIGDVCGHGPRAAAFGAAVRSGWKALAMSVPDDPLYWVNGLDVTFFRLGRHADTYVTLNTGLIELDANARWSFVSAGHPWPIVIAEQVAMVAPIVGPPLGATRGATWQRTERTLPTGATLLLYTDGLIENSGPGQGRGNDGEARLVEHLHARRLELDELLAAFGPAGFQDDVAVMTISVTASTIAHDRPAAPAVAT